MHPLCVLWTTSSSPAQGPATLGPSDPSAPGDLILQGQLVLSLETSSPSSLSAQALLTV